MFTGIVESIGVVKDLQTVNSNLQITLESLFTDELKIDQSISHNGVCLTVIKIVNNTYTVVAVKETLQKTNLGNLQIGDLVNLERSMLMNGRLDGHIVQGHVDTSAICKSIVDENGSWLFAFEYNNENSRDFITVEKGSVCVNGVSLTVVNSQLNKFSVAVIPYTFENTNFKRINVGTKVNLEFDIIGKYVSKYLSLKE